MGGLLDGLDDSGVDFLLVALAGVGGRLLLYCTKTGLISISPPRPENFPYGWANLSLLSTFVEFLLLGLLGLLLTRKVLLVELLYIDTSKINLS